MDNKKDLGKKGQIIDLTAYKDTAPKEDFIPLSAYVHWIDVDTSKVIFFPPIPDQLLLSHEMGIWPKRDYKAIVKENGETIALLKSDELDTLRNEVAKLEKLIGMTHTIYVRNEDKWVPIPDYAN